MNGVKKLYYSIGEVSRITDLEQYVLRYWESEFEQLHPAKNRAGNRVYTNGDIKLILHIKRLLRDEQYTVERTKEILRTGQPKEIISFPIESRVGIIKLYYSISEVSKITGLEQYELRYWETEFDQLQPAKIRAGIRIYTKRHIQLILYLKKLLRQEGYTVEGAKKMLRGSMLEEELPIVIPEKEQRRSIIQVTDEVTRKLIEYFSRHPEELKNMNRRKFEELVAELFKGFGYDVELTKQTRDGGRDIIALKSGEVAVKYLIECKRPEPGNYVSIAPVRELYGVKIHEGATKAILATTAHFSPDALRFFDTHKWELEPRDYAGIMGWIKDYLSILSLTSGKPK